VGRQISGFSGSYSEGAFTVVTVNGSMSALCILVQSSGSGLQISSHSACVSNPKVELELYEHPPDKQNHVPTVP